MTNTPPAWTLKGTEMILSTLTTAERERLAYIEGYTEAANLLARLDDMHHALAQATIDYENLTLDANHMRRRLDSLGEIC